MRTLGRIFIIGSSVGIASLCLIFLLSLVDGGSAMAQGSAIRHVDGDLGSDMGDCLNSPCKTIGYALSQSDDGESIAVAAGEYTESLTVTKAVSLLGAGPDSTTIRALPEQRVMSIVTSADGNVEDTITNSTVISGFTFTGGRAGGGFGGGLQIINASPTIRNNIIIDNKASRGGGIFANWSDGAVLIDNVIMSNTAGGWGVNFGGGLYALSGKNMTLIDNKIVNNNSENTGGGLYFQYSRDIELSGNEVIDNWSSDGGGMHVFHYSSLQLDHNIFAHNRGHDFNNVEKGYDILVEQGSTLTDRHSTLIGTGEGIGVLIKDSSDNNNHVTLVDTTIANLHIGVRNSAGSDLTLNRVLWYDNDVNLEDSTLTSAKQPSPSELSVQAFLPLVLSP